MRNRNVIEAEISKLQAELADVKEYECARDSAVHILKNLGWTRSRGQWVKPAKANTKLFDKDTMTHIKAGDFCASTETSSLWYVRTVAGNICWCSRVSRIAPNGTLVTSNNVGIKAENLKVINAKDYMGYTHR
ncbi:hypothetical protein P694_31 [Escherichia phage P694]|uniref:Uncharacterized protein n=1 Tax=Escherichia phage P694 TaxID=1572754 RepID=A0A0D3QHL0_9CAUD|nr:hypothetical protein P694_31 [Escherichia phage P694]AJF40511.1 hypothetical protein P694_31 [Escherichia phage P694]